MRKIRVMIVDDDPTWQKSLSKLLNNEREIMVVGTASDRNEAIRLSKALDIDILLIDINLFGNDSEGIYTAVEINQFCNAKTIMMAATEEEDAIINSFTAGAVNYILKGNYAQLPNAIYTAMRETSPFEILLKDYLRLKREEQLKALSSCEREVYELMEAGFSRSQMMKLLYKSENTIKQNIKSILKKLDVSNTKEAVQKIRKRGLVESPKKVCS